MGFSQATQTRNSLPHSLAPKKLSRWERNRSEGFVFCRAAYIAELWSEWLWLVRKAMEREKSTISEDGAAPCLWPLHLVGLSWPPVWRPFPISWSEDTPCRSYVCSVWVLFWIRSNSMTVSVCVRVCMHDNLVIRSWVQIGFQKMCQN